MKPLTWWQKAVFYQIYPRSFADGNGDGIGDFQGMIEKLDYLKDLGVDAVWLSPHYPSPLDDCGYDISDYCGVAPEYGTLDDFKQFLTGLHERGMYLVLDLVLNHTSDEHAWFQESRSSKDNPKHDWYVWMPGENGNPPNNWCSTFGGSAWELDPQTGEYYYHFFFKEQPDLNWRNPEVKAAMFDMVRFWLDLGVDGFRLDAIGTIYEDPAMPPHSLSLNLEEIYVLNRKATTDEEKQNVSKLWDDIFKPQHDQPGVHELMVELRNVINEYPDRVLIGETDDIAFYGTGDDELHLNFNFPMMRTDHITPEWVLANQQERLTALPTGAWPCNTLGNHDSPRLFSSFSDGTHNRERAQVHAALMLTLWGTPFLYNGEEIGMSDYFIEDPALFRDPLSNRAYQLEMELLGETPQKAAHYAAHNGRDRGRTPFQWKNSVNGGFSPEGVTPWLPVNPDYAEGVNAADQQTDPASMLNFYRSLLTVRKASPALQSGNWTSLSSGNPSVLAFLRTTPEQNVVVMLNMSAAEQTIALPGLFHNFRTLFNTPAHQPQSILLHKVTLAPFEILIAEQE